MEELHKPNQVPWFLRAFPFTFCVFILLFSFSFYFRALATPRIDLGYAMFATMIFAALFSLFIGFTHLHKNLEKFLTIIFKHFLWAAFGFFIGSIVVTWTYYGPSIREASSIITYKWLNAWLMMFFGACFPLIPWLFLGFLAGAVVVLLYRFISSGLKSSKRA